jgi:large subunit ribosomal protein L17
MAVIELIDEETVSAAASRVARRAASRGAGARGGDGAGRDRGRRRGAAAEQAAASDADATDSEVADEAVSQPAEGPTSDQTAGAADESQAEGDEDAAALAEVEESASTEDQPYGEGSHAPLEDGSQPDGFPVKGNASSMLYHVPGSSHYERTNAEVWFADAEAAEAAGFSLPPSQQPDDEASADQPAGE